MEESSQRRAILVHMLNGASITAKQADVNFGCMRLASRVHELRKQGHNVLDRWVYNGKKRYKEYYIGELEISQS